MTKHSDRSTDSTRDARVTTFRESCTNGQTITYVMKSIAYYNHPRHSGNFFQRKLPFFFVIAEYWAAWQACFKAFCWFYCCIMMMMIEGYSISMIFKVAFSILQLQVRLIYFITFKTINKQGRKTTTIVQITSDSFICPQIGAICRLRKLQHSSWKKSHQYNRKNSVFRNKLI